MSLITTGPSYLPTLTHDVVRAGITVVTGTSCVSQGVSKAPHGDDASAFCSTRDATRAPRDALVAGSSERSRDSTAFTLQWLGRGIERKMPSRPLMQPHRLRATRSVAAPAAVSVSPPPLLPLPDFRPFCLMT